MCIVFQINCCQQSSTSQVFAVTCLKTTAGMTKPVRRNWGSGEQCLLLVLIKTDLRLPAHSLNAECTYTIFERYEC